MNRADDPVEIGGGIGRQVGPVQLFEFREILLQLGDFALAAAE
jgi:hypothetical protein